PGKGGAAMSPYFGFEADFAGSLRCIPMAVRLRLDIAGVKLKLSEWSKLPQAARVRLAVLPCANPAEIENFLAYAEEQVIGACGAPPQRCDPADAAWEESGPLPDQVREKALSLGYDMPVAAWSGLTPLQRFALIKLSRPGHENRNFPLA